MLDARRHERRRECLSFVVVPPSEGGRLTVALVLRAGVFFCCYRFVTSAPPIDPTAGLFHRMILEHYPDLELGAASVVVKRGWL